MVRTYPIILQENHYYAYGSAIPKLSTANGRERYTYNGKELVEDFNINLHDYGARQYDPLTARWNGVDALAEKFHSSGSYNYVLGNPIGNIDPDGRDGIAIVDKENHTVVVNTVFHVSNEALERIKKFNPGAAKTIEELIAGFDDQYTPTTVSIDGEDYAVSFNLEIVRHETDAMAKAAFKEQRTKGKADNLFMTGSMAEDGYQSSYFRDGILKYMPGAGASTFAHEIGHGLGLDHPVSTSLKKTNQDKYEWLMFGKVPKIDSDGKPILDTDGDRVYDETPGLGGTLMSYRASPCLSYYEVQKMIKPAIDYPSSLSKKDRAKLGNKYTFRLIEN